MGLIDANEVHAAQMEKETDHLGGFVVFDSDIQKFQIEMLHLHVADSGAKALRLSAINKDKQYFNQDIYFTSGTAKGGKTYYTRNGKNIPLPGYVVADAICKLVTGHDLTSVPTETITVKQRDKAGKEVPTPVEAIKGFVGKGVALGLLKKIEDQSKKVGNQYLPTGQVRETNEIDKVFRFEDLMTWPEIEAGATEAAFAEKWLKKNKGQVRDIATRENKVGNVPGSASVNADGTAASNAPSIFANSQQAPAQAEQPTAAPVATPAEQPVQQPAPTPAAEPAPAAEPVPEQTNTGAAPNLFD